MEWMQAKGILKHWILPEQGLNKGMQYKNAPTGNALEFNTLDSNCNHDIHCDVLKYVSHTATLQNTDKQNYGTLSSSSAIPWAGRQESQAQRTFLKTWCGFQ
eukprot:10209503-Ditylum_brightwellii.AAC.1